jgi:hypothetical protein
MEGGVNVSSSYLSKMLMGQKKDPVGPRCMDCWHLPPPRLSISLPHVHGTWKHCARGGKEQRKAPFALWCVVDAL